MSHPPREWQMGLGRHLPLTRRASSAASPLVTLPAALLVALLAALAAIGCGAGEAGTGPSGAPAELRLGYFPNVTHATPIVGVAMGQYAGRLGATRLSVQTFNAGPSALEALLSGDLDATYIGPSPTINAFIKTRGEAIRIVAGATSGGAALVVRPGITRPEYLRGTRIGTHSSATPRTSRCAPG